VFIERPHAFAPEKLDFEVNCTLRVARVMRPPLACAATVVLLDVEVHVPPNSPVDVLKVDNAAVRAWSAREARTTPRRT